MAVKQSGHRTVWPFLSHVCVSVHLCAQHYEPYSLYRVNHHSTTCTNPALSAHIIICILKHITNASETHAHRPWPALVMRWPYVVKMLEGPWQSFVPCNENQFSLFLDEYFTSALTCFWEPVWKKCEVWGVRVHVWYRNNQESWRGSVTQNNFLFKETRVKTNGLILIIGAGFSSWY